MISYLDDIKKIVFARHSAHRDRGSMSKTSKVLSTTDTSQQRENKFAPTESLQVYKPHLRVDTRFRTSWPTENELQDIFENFCFVLVSFVFLMFYFVCLDFHFCGELLVWVCVFLFLLLFFFFS